MVLPCKAISSCALQVRDWITDSIQAIGAIVVAVMYNLPLHITPTARQKKQRNRDIASTRLVVCW